MPEKDILEKLEGIEKHLKKQDTERKRETRISNGRMLMASGMPVLGVGLGLLLWGALNINNYFGNYHVFSTSELYMAVVGALMVGFGLWLKNKDGRKEENMAKGVKATGGNKLTLEDIERHLQRQDKEIKKQPWIAGFFFGGAIFLVGISLYFQTLTPKYVDVAFLVLLGLAVMLWCDRQQKKIK